MSKLSEQQIHDDIINHIKKEGSAFINWYVGIASNPRDRLFSDHNVSEKNAWWIYRKAFNSECARNVEKFIINNYGIDGGIGGGDNSTIYVYAYRKTFSTVQ